MKGSTVYPVGPVEGVMLLPCPLCPAEAVLENTVTEAVVRCTGKHCGCRLTIRHYGRSDEAALTEVVTRWNTRHLAIMGAQTCRGFKGNS